jgi:hypothetical protein
MNPELLNYLKGKDNPFDVFVAARAPDAVFPSYHVATVHKDAFLRLNAILDRFRLERLETEADLPRSGVVLILGDRGMGKTHMLHALQTGAAGDDKQCVVVTPVIFEPHRSFIEYLLHQLVRHFQNETDGQSLGTLDLLADALARQVLVQAFHGMTETQWLARNVEGRLSFWQLFFGYGARQLADRKRLLIEDLKRRETRTIAEVCQQNEQEAGKLMAVALDHIKEAEVAHNTAGQIRRGLYTRLVRLAFGEPRERLYDFLLDGFTQIDATTQPSRETLVDELFQALLELCLLARLPVVFAFDALESLLGDPPEERVCHPFFKGLGDVLDSHKGIPFLLFAEQGHWQAAQRFMSEYVKQRFAQGVIRVPRYGSVSSIILPRLSKEQLGDVVAARVKPLLVDFGGEHGPGVLPTSPFQDDDLVKIARVGLDAPPLRQILQALRDRYDEIVNGQQAPIIEPPRPPPPPDVFVERLDACWQRELRAAKRKLEQSNLAGLADDLHAGVVKWLECLVAEGTATASGRPSKAANALLGSHPTYGQITTYQWSDGDRHRILSLGLLLGVGAGMPRDLETKLKIMSAPSCPMESLVILWPRGEQLQPPVHEHLPDSTRAVWDQFAKKGATQRVHLRSVCREDIAPWLALPEWLNAIRTEVEGAPPDVVHHFLAEATTSLLQIIAPRS